MGVSGQIDLGDEDDVPVSRVVLQVLVLDNGEEAAEATGHIGSGRNLGQEWALLDLQPPPLIDGQMQMQMQVQLVETVGRCEVDDLLDLVNTEEVSCDVPA